MESNLTSDIFTSLKKNKIIATSAIPNLEVAPYILESLLKGGVRWIEITLRTPVALEIMEYVHSNFPEMNIMAGTILDKFQVPQVQKAGAKVAVSPNINPHVLEEANNLSLPFIPGVATPTEIGLGINLGYKVFKFFPAEMIGGINYLKRVYAPFAHKNVYFIPLGGMNLALLENYIKFDFILAVGGSWIANADLIKTKSWSAITQNASQACRLATK